MMERFCENSQRLNDSGDKITFIHSTILESFRGYREVYCIFNIVIMGSSITRLIF